MKTSSHPLKLLYAALRMPKKDRKLHANLRTHIISREESLNRIFMVRYRMQNL